MKHTNQDAILSAIDYDLNFLMHYNTPGSHWYVNGPGKRFQAHAQYAMGKANPVTIPKIDSKKNHVYNLNSWGKDPEHNILFVTGFSGSGKSTLAESLKSKNTNVINLDLFTEQIHEDSKKERDKEFAKFLKDTKSDFYKIPDHEKYGIKIGTNRFGILLDDFQNSMTDFAKQQWKKGKRVVVEGVQLNDDTFFPDKNYFKDKPLVIPKTNRVTSFVRSGIRDDKLHLRDLMPSDIKEYVRWYNDAAKRLNTIKKTMK